ncbi:MAG: RNA polymerase sigma factor RpoD/SigA [Treponema sp.]|nr:RNA polymerase sigma factor RpoD/SigA [Treponema sp.]
MNTVKEKKSRRAGSDDNILSMYLREISNIPLLNREEEEKIARAAAKGNKAAREKLINANLRFVINVAKKYRGLGLSFEDLISEGNVGLASAVDRFDVEKGYRFISYAVWWIRQSIFSALCEKARLIRLPQNRATQLVQIEQARKMIYAHNSYEDEIREIADLLEMDKRQIRDLLNVSREMLSLEKTVSSDQVSTLGDYIEDNQYATPEQNAVQSVLEDDIENVLSTLDKKEADVIRYHYGLGQRTAMSLKEIGEKFNLSKERIRQIELKAMTRLQNPIRKEKLQAYVA